MQRLINLLRQQTISTHGHKHVGRFDADLEVLKIKPVQMLDMTQRGLYQRGRGWLAILFLQILFQRPGVHAYANRNPVVTGRIDHRLDAVFTADIAGVDAQAIHTQIGNSQGDLVVKMNISNQRHAGQLANLTKRLGRFHAGNRHPHDISTGSFQTLNLVDRSRHITGFGVGHTLH